MRKSKFNLVQKLMVLAFTCLAVINANAQEVAEYVGKMSHFGRLTEYQINSFQEYVSHNHKIKVSETETKNLEAVLRLQKTSLWNQVRELQDLYTKIYIKKTATKDERRALVPKEMNLSIAVHRQLLYLHKFINSTESSKTAVGNKELYKLSQDINAISQGLNRGEKIELTAEHGLGQVLQASKNPVTTACNLLAGFCLRKSMSNLMDSINEGNFLRADAYALENTLAVKTELVKHQKAVFILIGNHDQPLMDIALARKVALAVGSDHHITMTRKSVYPIPPPEKAGDVVFVVDNDPKANPIQDSIDKINENLLKTDRKVISLAVYPEGMLPYTGGQMPMTVKEGAFVVARRMAVQLAEKGIPVFLVQMKSNIIEHLTSLENIPARVNMEFIERVPTTEMIKGQADAWIEIKRVNAENSFNSHRGENQIDIFNLTRPKGSKIPYGMEIRKCSRVFAF